MQSANTPTTQELARFSETALKTEINRLREQNRSLLAENQLIHQHNQALHNCWQELSVNYSKGQKELRNYINEVANLKIEIQQLQAHLNPKDVAA